MANDTPLTPEERRRIARAPLPVVRTYGRSLSWAGIGVHLYDTDREIHDTEFTELTVPIVVVNG